MLEKCTGVSLRPRTQWPSHCFSWLQTMEHTTDNGLLSNSISPALVMSPSLNRRMTSGMLVWMGQPCWHRGRLQPRQRFASSTM